MCAIRRQWLSKSIQTVCRGNLAMLCSEGQFNFHLLEKSLAADRDRLRPAIVSSRFVSARSCFDPFNDAPFDIVATGHETTVGAALRSSATQAPEPQNIVQGQVFTFAFYRL